MLRTKLILISVAILSIFIVLPAIACHRNDTAHGQDSNCNTLPPEPICPCFDRAFLDTLHRNDEMYCDTNDNGDRPDRPELAVIQLNGASSHAWVRPGNFAWSCNTQEPEFIFQDMPVTFEERIGCAELLLTFMTDNSFDPCLNP